MISPDSRERLFLIAIGLLVLLGPVLILTLTLGTLVLFGDLALGRITPLEFLELYVIDLILVVGLAYGICQLTVRLLETRLPTSLDKLETRGAEESLEDESEPPEDR